MVSQSLKLMLLKVRGLTPPDCFDRMVHNSGRCGITCNALLLYEFSAYRISISSLWYSTVCSESGEISPAMIALAILSSRFF